MAKRTITITGLEKNRPIYKIHLTVEVDAAGSIADKVKQAGDIFLDSLCTSLEICGVVREEIKIQTSYSDTERGEAEDI